MKKIMFNDNHGLTTAVLYGRKTQTRRIVPEKVFTEWNNIDDGDEYSRSVYADSYEARMRNFLLKYAPFKVGEVVAISQSYFDIKTSANSYRPPIWEHYREWHKYLDSLPIDKGYYNKMFVRAELMLHQIEITNIRVQRLQDISEDDCLAEGIMSINGEYTFIKKGKNPKFDTPSKAYAVLIDKIYGKSIWERNPYVFVYNFKLIK